MANGFGVAADETEDVESESLTGLPSARAYETRAPEVDPSYAVVDETALDRVKRRLAKHLSGSGVLIVHDLAVPATATTIDHLCIGPHGVTAVDVERSPEGDGREALIRRVSREKEILAALLTEAGVRSEQIGGAICHTRRWSRPGAKAAHGIAYGHPRQVAKVARRERDGWPLDVQLTLAVVRNRLGHAGQRSYAITRPYVI